MKGDTAHDYAVKTNLTTKLILTETFGEAMKLLSSGKHDAVIIQQLVGYQIIQKLNIDNVVDIGSIKEQSLKPDAKPVSGFEQKFCIAVREGDRELLEILNEGLTITIANGTYERLYNEWFGPILPKAKVSLSDISRYLVYILTPILILGTFLAVLVLRNQIAKKTKALQSREEYLKTLVESIPDLVWLKDPNGVYLSCNRKFERFFGKKEAEIKGQTDYDFLEKTLADFFRKRDEMVIEAGKPITNEEEIIFAEDGHLEILETIKTPMYDRNKQLIGVLGIGRDITQRKKAEEELKRNKDQLESILSNFQGITYRCRMDKDWTMMYMTNQALELTGYPANDFINNKVRTFESIIHEEDAQNVLRTIIAALEIQEPWEIEYRINHRTDGIRWVFEKGKGAYDPEGKIECLDGFIINITEQKRSLQEKENLENQLRQAQKMEAVGRLAGGVAHDFNNMLSVILGNAEMVLAQLDNDLPFHKNMVEIQNAGRRSADITRQLLAFARKQTIAPKILDLNKTVEDMLKMLRRLIGEDIDLVWVPGGKLWPVRVDPSQVDQILANLSVNARDAINGVGKVTIETGKVTFDEAYCKYHFGFLPGDFVLLAVSDNGCGMEKETLANLFEPFYTTKGINKGTGLGLSTVYGIVKQNHGFINVYSEPNKGTVFKIYLPRHETINVQERPMKDPELDLTGKETILLVEDELSILKMTAQMLNELGYNVLTALTPGKAINLARKYDGDIHLVITDVVMPEMNGLELVKTLLSIYPNLNRLFMSGYTANVIAHHGVLDEGVNFIPKPFSLRELAQKVREILSVEKPQKQ